MKNKEEVRKELQELSPLLAKLKEREKPLDVPENYFDALPDQIWEQIKLMPQPEREQAKPGWWLRLTTTLQSFMQPRIAIGLATLAVLIVAGIFILKPGAEDNSEDLFASLSAEEVTAYISKNIHEFDTDLLIDAASAYPDMSIFMGSEFDDQEIEQLIDEVVKDLDDETLEELL